MTNHPVPVDSTGQVSDDAAFERAPAVVQAMRQVLGQADQQRQQLADSGDWQAIAYALPALKALASDLGLLVRAAEQDVAVMMPEKRVELPGLGVLERRKGTDRKQWQSEGLVSALVRSVLDPDGTGEFPADPVAAVDAAVAVLTECAPFTPSMGWRTKALREHGFDPDEWCESTPGRTTVQFHGTVQ